MSITHRKSNCHVIIFLALTINNYFLISLVTKCECKLHQNTVWIDLCWETLITPSIRSGCSKRSRSMTISHSLWVTSLKWSHQRHTLHLFTFLCISQSDLFCYLLQFRQTFMDSNVNCGFTHTNNCCAAQCEDNLIWSSSEEEKSWLAKDKW